jgi:Flp pilus assembly pilin Flp
LISAKAHAQKIFERTLVAGMAKQREKLCCRETGATIVEYAVLLALFALLVVGAVVLIENKVNNSFDAVTNELANPPGS